MFKMGHIVIGRLLFWSSSFFAMFKIGRLQLWSSSILVRYLQKNVTFFPPSHFDSKTSFAVFTVHSNAGERLHILPLQYFS